jgi:hypothetical protein
MHQGGVRQETMKRINRASHGLAVGMLLVALTSTARAEDCEATLASQGEKASAASLAKCQKELKERETAAASVRPQVLAVRGGSLGFSMPSNHQGLLTGVDAKLSSGSPSLDAGSSVDAFAKIGGVTLGNVMGEVIGESFEADVPQVSLTAMPVSKMRKTTFASVGIRARLNLSPIRWMTPGISKKCGVAEGEGSNPPSGAGTSTCGNDELDVLRRSAVWSFMAGLRLVRRSTANDELLDLTGLQWELGARRDSEAHVESRYSWAVMGGVSGMHLNQSEITTDMETTRYIRMNDVRLSGAAELRQPAPEEKGAVTGAIGVYGVASLNMWTNQFGPDGVRKERDYQLEGGLYLSGAMRGFNGLIMLSMIRPYERHTEMIYALSIVPFGGVSTATPR